MSGITPRGEIVGTYTGTDNAQHGYLLTHGKFITVDAPGADNTSLYGIGANGDILGEWTVKNGPLDGFNGFLLRDGNFTPMEFPGAIGTIPAMTAAQRVVGGYCDSSETAHGFLLADGVYDKIDCPGATFYPSRRD